MNQKDFNGSGRDGVTFVTLRRLLPLPLMEFPQPLYCVGVTTNIPNLLVSNGSSPTSGPLWLLRARNGFREPDEAARPHFSTQTSVTRVILTSCNERRALSKTDLVILHTKCVFSTVVRPIFTLTHTRTHCGCVLNDCGKCGRDQLGTL